MHWADEQQRQWRRQQQQREEEQQRRLDARREAAQSFDAIVQMGFSPEAAANALAASGGRLQPAIDLLVGGGADDDEEEEEEEEGRDAAGGRPMGRPQSGPAQEDLRADLTSI